MVIALPTSPEAFAHATWEEIAPYYEALATAPLTHDSAEEWLATWSRLEELLQEAGTVAMIAYTGDTADPDKEAVYLRFSAEIYPRADEQQVRLAARLLDSGYTRPDLEVVLREFRTDREIFREANVPLFSQIEELSARYQKITGGLTVEWEGERRTIPQLNPILQSHDRALRERAFRAGAEAYLAVRDELAETFDRMLALRQQVARNAGFANFRDYSFAAKHRFDYAPEQTARFHQAVEDAVVPVAERLLEDRRRRLGVETLRPWDLNVDPDDSPPLRPFTSAEGLVGHAEKIFDRVDAELGRDFRLMANEDLLDLESRMGKAPGGYCTKLSFRKRPFIFMNAVGMPDDVNTLVHEAGHCFHAFLASPLPFIWQRGTGSEASELASMSMELLAAPFLEEPTGYYSPIDARRAWVEHLEDVVLALPHIASVDAFQDWIYTSGSDGADRAARDEMWLRIRSRFERGLDWSTLEPQRVARWYRQLHIFELPFYYIEYGVAQLGALQLWRHSLSDHKDAVRRYKQALALGNTRSLPAIYHAAGAELLFDAAGMRELVELAEQRIMTLRRELDGERDQSARRGARAGLPEQRAAQR